MKPRFAAFTVAGIFEAGIQDNDANIAFVNLSDASELKGLHGAAEGVAVRLDDPLAVAQFRASSGGALGPELRYSDWAEEHRNLFNAIHIEKMMMRIILMFIVAVAAFNIVASLMMVVIDKRKDIAILRTYGLEPKRVARIFLVQGAMIGFLGTVGGIALGLVCAFNLGVIVPWLETTFHFKIMPGDVYYVTEIPSEVHWFDVVSIPPSRSSSRCSRRSIPRAAQPASRLPTLFAMTSRRTRTLVMKQPYELSIAVRYLRARSSHSFISFISAVSMIGIGLAVAVLIVVLSVMNGFESRVAAANTRHGVGRDDQRLRRAARRLAVDAHARARESRDRRGRAVRRGPGARGRGRGARGRHGARRRSRARAAGIEHRRDHEAREHRRARRRDSYNVVIGANLATTLGVDVGDELVLVLAEGRVTPAGLMPRVTRVQGRRRVRGRHVRVRPRPRVRELRRRGQAVPHGRPRDGPAGSTSPIVYDARAVAEETAQAFANERGKNFYVDDWTRQHYTYFRSIQLQKSIMFVILSLVIAVAAFNIVSTLMMVVRDKRGDIAILQQLRHDAAQHHDDLRSPGHVHRRDRHADRHRAGAAGHVAARQLRRAARGLVRHRSLVGGRVLLERPADAAAAARGARDLGARARARDRRHVLSRVQRRAPAAGRGP